MTADLRHVDTWLFDLDNTLYPAESGFMAAIVDRMTDFVERVTGLPREEAFRLLHSKGVYKGWADDALMAFVTHALKDSEDGGVELKCHPSREADIFSSAPDRLWGLLGKVRTPTMVLHAEKTFPFVTESVARWQGFNEAVQATQVPGGHCFMQEQPEMAARHVRAFLLPG